MTPGKFQRQTVQRQVILDALAGLTSHPTAPQLYEIVRRRLPRISLGTVYRNLELMAEKGMICKLEGAGAESRFDADLSPHHHVRCVQCGRLEDLPGPPLDLSLQKQHDCSDFQLIDYRLELRGICRACQEQPSPPRTDCSPATIPPRREKP